MVSAEDSYYTYEYPEHFKILPAIHSWHTDFNRIKDGARVPEGFVYASDTNPHWIAIDELRRWIEANRDKIGRI